MNKIIIDNELIEKLAEIEHTRWVDWQSWCHKILRGNCPSEQMEKVLERWDKQIATSYENLSESEKDSDREQVDRYLPIIKDLVLQKQKEVIETVLKKIKEIDTKPCMCAPNGNCEYNKGFKRALENITHLMNYE